MRTKVGSSSWLLNLWESTNSQVSHNKRRISPAKVWEGFEETDELYEDGYFVRLPWREEAKTLSDNKAIAHRQLCTLLNKLQDNTEILKQYYQIFLDQIQEGIIEKIDSSLAREGDIIHFLIHQTVVTPDKVYTKLQVVFDAFAHFKDQPSLNDVLYQGPDILQRCAICCSDLG